MEEKVSTLNSNLIHEKQKSAVMEEVLKDREKQFSDLSLEYQSSDKALKKVNYKHISRACRFKFVEVTSLINYNANISSML